MEGLESKRHLNFKTIETPQGLIFTRDRSVVNTVVFNVGVPGDLGSLNRVHVKYVEFDTSYYTQNNVYNIYSMEFYDELSNTTKIVGENISLNGNSINVHDLHEATHVTKVTLKMTEGGLTRFKMFGTPSEQQLPNQISLLRDAKIFQGIRFLVRRSIFGIAWKKGR